MNITQKLALLISMCAASVCGQGRRADRYTILQSPTSKVYVDPYMFRFWPKDHAGMQTRDAICPKGYTCLPNFIKPPREKMPQTPRKIAIKNIKYKPKIYIPTTAPGGGCLGLEEFNEVGLQSVHNNMYLGACTDCVDAKYRNMAMVFTSFDNPAAKWKFVDVDGKCAIKNVHLGMFLSRCVNCTANISVSLLSVSQKTIDDNSNDELWAVARKQDGTYTFKSAATGEYLSICEGCLAGQSTVTSPAALFSSSSDFSFVSWAVNVSFKKSH